MSFLPRSSSWALAHISTLLGIITWILRLIKNLCILLVICCKSGFPGSKLLRWDLHPWKLVGECSRGQYLEGAWKKQGRAQGVVEFHCSSNRGFSQSSMEFLGVVPVGPKRLDLSILLYFFHQPANRKELPLGRGSYIGELLFFSWEQAGERDQLRSAANTPGSWENECFNPGQCTKPPPAPPEQFLPCYNISLIVNRYNTDILHPPYTQALSASLFLFLSWGIIHIEK